jgi:hypothetical protein
MARSSTTVLAEEKQAFWKLQRPPGDNVAMDTGEQVAAEIIDAIRSGRDIWVFDQILQGPDRLEQARKLVLERRAACSDPDEVAFLTSIIGRLETERTVGRIVDETQDVLQMRE